MAAPERRQPRRPAGATAIDGRRRIALWTPGGLGLAAFAGLPAALIAEAGREMADGRAFLWLPVTFGIGVALYFGADHEPSLPASAALFAALLAGAVLARRRVLAFYALAGLAAVAGGFAIATAHVAWMAHPVLDRQLVAVNVAGFVARAENRPRGGRVVLIVTALDRMEESARPVRVRLAMPAGALPRIGDHVAGRATLGPPPGPAYPGGYDFGRDAWFDGIGATGFTLGRLHDSPAPGDIPFSLRLARWLEDVRAEIGRRIRAVLSGSTAGIAVALVAGSRDAVPESIEESMRVSGLSHVLSISGLHMALVATGLFVAARALFAAVPGLALRYPIKAWAAIPAIVGATFYLILSGAEVPTQRSYVMTLIVLTGLLIGRSALTLRTLAFAALGVLVLSPASLFEPGTQMSFAATLALVAAYEAYGRLPSSPLPRTGAGAKALRYLAASVFTSIVAGLATAPYAAFHFQRLAPLGVLSNLLALPLVSLVIMPAGLIGAILMPFGWDGPAWVAMGWGIDGMVAISSAVAALPGADRSTPAFPLAALTFASLALIGLCLFRTRLILLAPLCFLASIMLAASAQKPDVLVDPQGRTVAVRRADGQLSIMSDTPRGTPANRFAVEQWLAADGSRGRSASPDLAQGVRCDPTGCAIAGTHGRVALSRSPDSLADDCRLATILVARFDPPPDCVAYVVRTNAATGDAIALTYTGNVIEMEKARPAGRERPWLPKRDSEAPSFVGANAISPGPPDAAEDGFALPAPEVQ